MCSSTLNIIIFTIISIIVFYIAVKINHKKHLKKMDKIRKKILNKEEDL